MNFTKWINDRNKLELIEDYIVTVDDLIYFDKNDEMQFTERFKKWDK